jgi:hypothetical protein
MVCTLFDRTGSLVALSTEAKKFSRGQELAAEQALQLAYPAFQLTDPARVDDIFIGLPPSNIRRRQLNSKLRATQAVGY